MKTLKFLILAIIATGLAACGDDNEAMLPPVSSRPLTISVSETPYINPDAPAGAPQSRAAITTTSSLSSFNLVYVYGSGSSNSNSPYSVTNSAGTWSGGSWPDTDYAVNWYAFSDGTFYLTDDEEKYPYIDFSVEESSANQKDLLVSTASGTYAGTGGKLSFTFDHACSALRFLVKKAKNLSDYTLTVSGVQLCNVVKTGEYHYNTSSWTLGATTASYTLFSGSKTLGTTDYVPLDASSAPYLFFIPQTLTPWGGSDSSKTYLKVTCVLVKDATEKFNGAAYIPFGATLVKGHQYDVKINIGKISLLKSDGTQIITD